MDKSTLDFYLSWGNIKITGPWNEAAVNLWKARLKEGHLEACPLVVLNCFKPVSLSDASKTKAVLDLHTTARFYSERGLWLGKVATTSLIVDYERLRHPHGASVFERKTVRAALHVLRFGQTSDRLLTIRPLRKFLEPEVWEAIIDGEKVPEPTVWDFIQ